MAAAEAPGEQSLDIIRGDGRVLGLFSAENAIAS
jgi:hypothetical protein